jgi:GntR family transcriptional regulator
MALWIQISPGSKEPIYTQIYDQISQAILSRNLTVGDKLPAVRKLAGELVINPNTVARAYTQLEQQGLVTTRIGSGTFVIDPQIRTGDAIQVNLLCERLDSVITQARTLGLSQQGFTDICTTHIQRFYQNQEGR